MRSSMLLAGLWPAVVLLSAACGGGETSETADAGPPEIPLCTAPTFAPPECGTGVASFAALIPGPSATDFDTALADKTLLLDRQFHVLNGYALGAHTNVNVGADDATARATITSFLTESQSWDFQATTGVPVTDVIDGWHAAAGAYAGVGIAADAFRYGVLRDLGAACEDVARARDILVRDLALLHAATAITGVKGVIARSVVSLTVPGAGTNLVTTPLFDDAGTPLPAEKDNGTWRADNSGLYPDLAWSDSASRDQYVGWVIGMAGAWEVIRDDPEFETTDKERLQVDAADMARALMVVGSQGYDLEIPDADGRVTFHGYMHHEALERTYIPDFENGFHAVLGLGIIAGLAYVSEQQDVIEYLNHELIWHRRLHEITDRALHLVDFGTGSNFSTYNMAFDGGWLASRYVCDADARALVAQALDHSLYNRPGKSRQPIEQGQALYDLVYAAANAGATAWAAGTAPDTDAVERALSTLQDFPAAPYFSRVVKNCDDLEIESLQCIAEDGVTPITVLDKPGWNDERIAAEPLPISLRPPSDYFWRSNPYAINGGTDDALYPAGDYRFAYWLGRWVRTD